MNFTCIKIILSGWLLMYPALLSDSFAKENMKSDAVLGIWLSGKQDSKIEIVKNPDGTFSGKIVWAKTPYQAFEGVEIMKGVTYNVEDNTYICPWIYSPRLNITAKAVITVLGDELRVKAKKGIISTVRIFTRAE